jgi:hypothetical protein
MAIVTCPECGQHPVSDRAPTCPKCGCPIAAVSAPVASINPSSESTDQASTIRDERNAKLEPLRAGLSTDSTDYPDCSVVVCDLANLAKLVSQIQDWCEELIFVDPVNKSHINAISRLSNLKSLILPYPKLDDEALYRISKLQTLCKLVIQINEASTQASSWLQLARLSRLEYLQLPPLLFPNDYSPLTQEIKQNLRLQLPRTIIK